MKHYAPILLLLALCAVFTACDDDDHRDNNAFIVNGILVRTPPGGTDFGTVSTFDTLTYSTAIASSVDADGFDFVLDAPAQVMISVESLDALNPLVELYDNFGEFVAGDDDSGVGSDALLVGTIEPGFYTILVWSSLEGGATAGDYELTVLIGDDQGGDFETLAINQTKSMTNNTLASDAGSATWAVTLEDPSALSIDVMQTSGMADITLQVIDQRGNIVSEIDPAGIDDPVFMDVNLLRGTYLIVLLNAELAMAGTYDIAVSAQAQGAP